MTKRAPKTKEQIVRDMEVSRKRSIVVDKFYPALKEATLSVDEAKMLLQATGSLIMESVLKTMQERKFSEIKDVVVDKLSHESEERRPKIEALLDVLTNENLYVTREIVEGMSRAIEQMVAEDLQGRTLDTLKPDWERYLVT